MNRRHFQKNILLGMGGISMGMAYQSPLLRTLHRPKKLAAKQTISLITPGSYISDDGLQKAVTNLESLGLLVKLGANIRAEHGYIAGNDIERLSDLYAAFEDPQTNAVWCARGGYGCGRLLPKIDFKHIRKHPKALIGYSDITALHCAFEEKARLISFHGPLASSDFTDYARQQLDAVLFQGNNQHIIRLAPSQKSHGEGAFQPNTIKPGVAEGRLVGGNLTLLAALAGTGYLPRIKDSILFLEDIGEKPYRIDRMLTTLRQAWPLEMASGIVLGVFDDCEADEDDRSLSLKETLQDRFGDLGIPVLSGFSFGHIADQCILPVGVRARLNTEQQTVTLLEAGVE